MEKRVEMIGKKENVEQFLYEVGYRALLFRKTNAINIKNNLSDFEQLILEVLNKKVTLSISELSNIFASSSGSSVSTTITKLWRDKKLVNKKISPENQRVTLVNLTSKGKKVLQSVREQHYESYKDLREAVDLNPEEEEALQKFFHKALDYFDKIIFSE